MRITLCDDEEAHLALISSYAAEYIEEERLDVEIKKFLQPDDLLRYERQNEGSEIYLLDIVMDNMSGLELGRHIREYNKRAVIIYLTTASEFSLDAFSVHAFSYLLKPIQKEKLFYELNNCFKYCVPIKKKNPVITIRTVDGVMPTTLNTVNAIEYLDHRLVYHMTDNSKLNGLSSREPFDKQTKEIISFNTFIKSANSYLVNMQNILFVTARSFKMKNGSEFPITRKYASAKESFLKFKLGKEGK